MNAYTRITSASARSRVPREIRARTEEDGREREREREKTARK
jgi:hypothetical protein